MVVDTVVAAGELIPIDGEPLADPMIQHNIGVSKAAYG